MTDLYARVQSAAAHLRARAPARPRVAVILGSGLGNFAASIKSATRIPYAEIPQFPQSTVEGHAGNLFLGYAGGVPVAVMQGRVHAYEGYTMEQVTFPTRVLGMLGCTTVILTNAAGAIRTTLTRGQIVVISDHINFTGSNAAAGPNEPRFTVTDRPTQRFFDMSNAYSPRLRALAIEEATRQQLALTEGVYLAVLGPSFETPAEIRAFRALGADLVGMSTVHETIAARHMDMEVLGLSVVTNMAAGVLDRPLDHVEVLETGRQIDDQFTSLLTGLIPRIAALPAA